MKILNIFLFAIFTSLSAAEDISLKSVINRGMPLPSDYSSTIISQSTRAERGWNFTIWANFNEYQATADSLELGFSNSLTSGFYSSNLAAEGEIPVLDFNYHPGFEVGFILDTPYDNWNFGGGYLWFRGRSKGTAKLKDDTYYFSEILPFDSFLNSMNANWDLDIDLIDVYLERPYFSGTRFSMNPNLGLRSGWIRQDFDLTAIVYPSFTNTQSSFINSHAWMIGPKLGFEGNFILGYGFSFFSNLETSLLFTKYSTLNYNSFDNLGDTFLLTNSGVSFIRPAIESGLGVNWEYKGRFKINFSAAYNLSIFFSQNMSSVLIDLNSNFNTPPANLYLSGLSIGGSFAF